MMDRDWRLQRYQHKDYTDLVEFPVEIVGRDGAVRRYSFEDSIRLYQRRITFAPLRYRDAPLVDAEVHHCRSRIEQLRRSFFFRHGWGSADGSPQDTELFGELAGEIAAFFCRVLRTAGRLDLSMAPEPGAEDPHQQFLVRVRANNVGPEPLRLYVFRFEGTDRDRARDRFFRTLRGVDDPPDERDERLVAFHHTADCGLVLTSDGPSPLAHPGEEDAGEPPPDPWHAVLSEVRAGDLTTALSSCRALVRDQPWHLKAYVLGAAIASHLELPWIAEDLGALGSRYFPNDPMLLFLTGLARARAGRCGQATVALDRAVALDPAAEHASVALHLARAAACQLPDSAGPYPVRPALRALAALQMATWAALAICGATALTTWSVVVAEAVGVVVAAVVAQLVATRWWALRALRRPAFDEVALALRHVRALAATSPKAH
jgi:hypothetical protein